MAWFYGASSRPFWNWVNRRDGISFEPYCIKFNKSFKERIRNTFGRVCFLCGKNELKNGRKLDVHHVNYDKTCLCNDLKCEFVPLCISCHSKTSGQRNKNEQIILDKLVGLSAGGVLN